MKREIFQNYNFEIPDLSPLELRKIRLLAVSPIDGRYGDKTQKLQFCFSEAGLIAYRIVFEVEYLIAFAETVKDLNPIAKKICENKDFIRSFFAEFSLDKAALRVKEIEDTTNHDVNAVIEFIKETFESNGIGDCKEWVHICLTSFDVDTTARVLMLKYAIKKIYIPLLNDIKHNLHKKADSWREISMLARTHGQPASPTGLGKEINVFWYRLSMQIKSLEDVTYFSKLGGATGNLNSNYAMYPNIRWDLFAENFLTYLGLEREEFTTQISGYDNIAEIFDNMRRINTILIDCCRDLWTYISMDYIKQKPKEGEVGSSTMPHKVNPIDFENAEGNLGFANAILEFFSAKLPISRLQRDLTDSTVIRNVGVPIGHSIIAFQALLKGLGKIEANIQIIEEDLNNHWEIVTEGIQMVLRREGFDNAYNTLKKFSRGKKITQGDIETFIFNCDIPDNIKDELRSITTTTYVGNALEL